MSIWKRFLYWIGLRSTPGSRYYEVSENLHVTLSTLASHEGRPEHELAQDLIAAGLNQYYSKDELWKKWESLTRRERDIAAFVCLGFTNKEIAARLHISPDTVKAHLKNLLVKFQLHTRAELRLVLSEWDFSAWDK